VPCAAKNSTGTLDYKFGNATISSPLADNVAEFEGGCYYAANPTEDDSQGKNTLGDTFLRSAYVVFDQDNRQVSFAQYINCGTNEQTIPATGAASFVGQCSSATVTGSGNGTGSTGPGKPTSAADTSAIVIPAAWAFVALMITLPLL
jgi:hypothetical protein